MAGNNYPTMIMPIRTAQEAVQFLVTQKQSQKRIATRAGVTQPTISRILAGEHDPKGSTLIKLNEFADEVMAEAKPESQPQ